MKIWLARILIITLIFCSASCKQKSSNPQFKKTIISIDSLKLRSYADTVVCDMVVKNPDKEDTWTAECLNQLKRKALIDSIFDDVYKGKLIAYDFTSHGPLSIKELKKIEESVGYSRDIIGKFQFREAWFYDKSNHSFIKKVHSIIFGYETYDLSGFVKGYKPLFKIDF
jgi:hypothetical protein